MALAGFEPTILAKNRPQTNTLDSAATGIDLIGLYWRYNPFWVCILQP